MRPRHVLHHVLLQRRPSTECSPLGTLWNDFSKTPRYPDLTVYIRLWIFVMISRYMWTSPARHEATPTLSKITLLLPGDTFSASSPRSHFYPPSPTRSRGSCASGADTPGPGAGRPRSLRVRRHAAETLMDSFTCSRSCCLALALSRWIFAVFKTSQSVYCGISAIVCFKFDSCFIQLPSVEAAR